MTYSAFVARVVWNSDNGIPVDIHNAEVRAAGQGLDICIEGYGQCEMEDGFGVPIYLDLAGPTPKLHVWADINNPEPTHVIDLSGAAEKERKDE